LGISTIRQLSGSANAIAPFSRHHGLSDSTGRCPDAEAGDDVEHLVRGGETEVQKILAGRRAVGASVVVRGELEVVFLARQVCAATHALT
jgi:hypothetical protein